MKKFGVIFVVIIAIFLSACGSKVEVPPAAVGKVMGKDGYREGLVSTSKFRLDPCFAYCERLVTMSIADFSVTEPMDLFMPQDKLTMSFDLRLTLSPNPNEYDSLFNRINPDANSNIPMLLAYETYAEQIIRSQTREILSQYTIEEIASSREAVNGILTEKLTEEIMTKTPFMVRYAGLGDIVYPPVIVEAQENAAERREQIQQEEAQLEISKVTLERELQEERLRRAIALEKAEAEAKVNEILAGSVTPEYITYRQLEALQAISNSDNTKFLPVEMLSSMASQVMLAEPGRR